MARLPFEAFLALRYLRPRRTFVSVITVISIIGVALGVLVLIVVIAVMSGFDREWRNRILGFNAHLKVYRHEPGRKEVPLPDYEQAMGVITSNSHVKGVAPFVRGQVLIETQPGEGQTSLAASPVLRGVDPSLESHVSVLPTNIVAGRFDVEGNGLLIGREFARGMDLNVGDRVAVYSPSSLRHMKESRGKKNEEAVLPEEYTIRGIFDVGFSDYNSSIVIASLENAQELYELQDAVHGLQIMLDDPFQADAVRTALQRHLGAGFHLLTWKEENPQLFSALAVEKNLMFFLLFFIMIVAAFGIVNCQITFVVQKTREIGILKALGANQLQVLWIFLSQSVIVGTLGVGCGLGLAMLALGYRNQFLEFLRHATGFELLPASIYQLYELPASIETLDVTLICGAAFLACVLAGLFPAWKASRLQPVEALRHE